MLKIYDTLSKQKREFKPLSPEQVTMYVCGITVYDYCHIGHARTAVAFDVVYRYLKHRGYNVRYVRNITDIDDKIIKRAQERNQEFTAVTATYIDAMHEDYDALSVARPDLEPKATDTIAGMLDMITTLIAQGAAYVGTNGDVYFKISAYDSYGALSKQDLESLKAGARIEVTDDKQDPLDFVLWKKAKPGEPSWPSPWGAGRPGWHIECSAMSTEHLGPTIDIHGGGNDLTFPHHENERAQSECATGKTFVNNWLHVGFVNVDDEKMSKSLNNFFTIRDVLTHYNAETIRYFLVASHYRSPVNYSEENLNQARASLATLYTALRGFPVIQANTTIDHPASQAFCEALDDDFNTPVALSALFELARDINKLKQQDDARALALAGLLKHLASVLGILQQDCEQFFQSVPSDTEVDKAEIERLIVARKQARAEKNWAQADQVRDQLDALGVILEDGPGGTTWRFK